MKFFVKKYYAKTLNFLLKNYGFLMILDGTEVNEFAQNDLTLKVEILLQLKPSRFVFSTFKLFRVYKKFSNKFNETLVREQLPQV